MVVSKSDYKQYAWLEDQTFIEKWEKKNTIRASYGFLNNVLYIVMAIAKIL